MAIKVAIAGASGYAGGEILRLLLGHPAYLGGELEVGALTGNSSSGRRLGELMPQVVSLRERVIEPTEIDVLSEHDVVFLALPHGKSGDIVRQLPESVKVVDCAADYRLHDSHEWVRYYGSVHAGWWPYGLPEIPGHRQSIRSASRVAVPGCFPTGATLALLPAIAERLIVPDVAITSITGVSGGGKKAAVSLLGAETMGSVTAYKTAGTHRHVPEIIQNLSEMGEVSSVSFTPVRAPLSRGILTVATAPLADDVDAARARCGYENFYRNERFVVVLAKGCQPDTRSVTGANVCQVQVEVDGRAGRLVATSAIDNLTKGTGGAAVQCMNLMLGWEESAGLSVVGLAP